MQWNIRNAEKNDLSFLLQLEKEVFPFYQQNSKQAILHGIKSGFQETWIVETTTHNTVPVGAMVLFKYKRTLRLYSIGILLAWQKKGIGDLMMERLRNFALDNNYQRIILEVKSKNTNLVNWYISKGFKLTAKIKNYYCPGIHANKMEWKLNQPQRSTKTNNLVVINQPFKWHEPDVNATIITVKEYINNPVYQNNPDFRVFNLCSSYKYQSYGYYVSLLASARGQRVIPSITTIRDFRISNVIQSAAYEMNELINRLLEKHPENQFTLHVYFGHTIPSKYNALAFKLYQLFEAPLFKVNFIKVDKWMIKDIKSITINHVPPEHSELMYTYAAAFLHKKRHNYPKLTNYKYDLAILVNPNEENPPSNAAALQKLKEVAHKKGIYVEFITKADKDKINEFDALFIRETTNVNHHTYEISRFAYAEGLVVIDDPWSILRCSNKIYQNELFKKNKILTPNTTVLTKNLFDKKIISELKYPVVLKQPDSAFSQGVIKVKDKTEAEAELTRLFKISDMVICQEFLYSEFDWRIGILDNKPLFACKYYMSKDHWQIYNWNTSDSDHEGDSETLPTDAVPLPILHTAQQAASLIGDGLYGVDLKYVDGKVYVVEVNDNPNIDAGVEDLVLKDALYEQLIESLINRIEIAKNIRKLNFTHQNKS